MANTRNRAWRRFKNRINKSRDQKHDASLYDYPAEKCWKMMYGRSEKMIRAAQLGMAYPQISQAVLTRNACDEEKSL